MEMSGRVVVVTGGAGGIGAALARRAAGEGAAGVVVVDRNGPGAVAVAASLGVPAFGRACDVTDEVALEGVLAEAEATFGPVEFFFANAGVAIGTDLTTSDEDWELAWRVNTYAHVLAARILVPGWVARRGGCFVTTASAAGLLSQIGSAPYSVTKHAAVAFAEWLSITYGDAGVQVHCLCPQGVNTNMLNGGVNTTGVDAQGAAVVKLSGRVLEPDEVAEAVVQAIREGRFLILPHPEVLTYWQRKTGDTDRWLAGMRKLQARTLDS